MSSRIELLSRHLQLNSTVKSLGEIIPALIRENPDLDPEVGDIMLMQTVALDEVLKLANLLYEKVMEKDDIIEQYERLHENKK